MIEWKRLYPKPAGSLPGGIVTQWGVALITVLILIFVALWLASGGTEQAEIDSIGGEVTGPARNFAGQMAAQVEAEALRAETRRAAAERTLQAQQRQEAREVATGAIGGGEVTMDEALLLAGPSPETGRAYTTEEFELRERLRPRTWKPGSLGAAESFASQFAGGSDLPAIRPRQITGAGGRGARLGRSDPRRGIGSALSSPWDVPGCDGQPGR